MIFPLLEIIKIILNTSNIVAFGDSHSFMFSDIDGIDHHHLGPALCYNLIKENSNTRAREQIHEKITNYNPKNTTIILSFGEIDCRVYIVKRSKEFGTTIWSEVDILTERYLKFITELTDLGYRVIVYGPHSSRSSIETPEDPQLPTQGSDEERNYAIHIFNLMMNKKCENTDILCVSMDDIVIDKVKWKTRQQFLKDGCHLSAYPDVPGPEGLHVVPELKSILLYKLLKKLQLTEIKNPIVNEIEVQ